MSKPDWGLLPDEVRDLLRKREWQHSTHLKQRLKGSRPFPLVFPLKAPPSGNAVLDNAEHFQQFVAAWQAEAATNTGIQVEWNQRHYRHFAEQSVPVSVHIPHIQGLAEFLGKHYADQLAQWQNRFRHLFQRLPKNSTVFECLVDFLSDINQLSDDELEQLTRLIPQLTPMMGRGIYLRALPLQGVDTKFIEQHFSLIEALLHSIHGEVKPQGLLHWLGCLAKPKDWLLVKPLCAEVQKKLGNLPLLRLNSDTLRDFPLPAKRIVIVENEQSCLALPALPDGIAVGGGGKNLAWLDADWLAEKQLAYWGDLDLDGLAILNQAKQKHPLLTPLMMDEATLRRFQARMVSVAASIVAPATLSALSAAELRLFEQLQQQQFGGNRLEQERIDQDWVAVALMDWLKQS